MKIITVLLIIISTTSCGVSKRIDYSKSKTDYIKYNAVYAQEWTGGAPGSGSGVDLFIPVALVDSVRPLNTYFQGMIETDFNYTDSTRSIMVVRFKRLFNNKPDLIMDGNSHKEAVNEAPVMEKFPFELEDDQAVIRYKTKSGIYNMQLNDIEIRSMLEMPSMPQ